MNNIKKIQALRDFCDFAEQSGIDFSVPLKIYRSCNSADEFHEAIRQLGSFEKSSNDSFLEATKKFGEGLKFEVFVLKSETCKRVVVGKKTVPFKAAETLPEIPEHEEDIVKWECPESFLDIKKEPVSVKEK